MPSWVGRAIDGLGGCCSVMVSGRYVWVAGGVLGLGGGGWWTVTEPHCGWTGPGPPLGVGRGCRVGEACDDWLGRGGRAGTYVRSR